MRLILLLAATVAALAQTPSDYLPLQTGNTWLYRVTGRVPSEPVVMSVGNTVTVGDNTYYEVTGIPVVGRALLRVNSIGTLVAVDETTRSEVPWVAFRASSGEAFESRVHPCVASGSITSRKAKADLPVGSLTGLLAVEYGSFTCADAGISGDWFAPEVGMVRRSEITFAGPKEYQLIYARVAGNTVLTQGEQSYAISLGRLVYEENQQPFTMLVRLTLRNTLADALELNFRSSQRYNLVIRNEAGQEVYNWAADKLFAQVTETIKLKGERVWAASLTLPTRLPAGKYTMESMITSTPVVYRAQVGFEVRAAATTPPAGTEEN